MNQQKFSGNLTSHLSVDAANKIREKMDRSFWPIIGTANQCAAIAVYSAYDAIVDDGLLKKKIKAYAPKCINLYDDYYQKARKYIGSNYGIWDDLTNIAAVDMQPEVERLYDSISELICKHEKEVGFSDGISSKIRAQVFAAQALADLAVSMFDSLTDTYQNQTPYNIKRDYMFARLSSVKNMWGAVTHEFSHTKGRVDLNEDRDCKDAMQAVVNKYADSSFMDAAAHKAFKIHPELKGLLTEEEKKTIYGTEKDTTKKKSVSKGKTKRKDKV